MTSRLACPNGHPLAVTPKMAGKSVRCPKCSAVVRIPTGSDPGPDKKAIREGKAQNRLRERQLEAACLGLAIYRWKFVLYVAALIAGLIGIVLVPVIYGLAETANEQRSTSLIKLANLAIRVLGYCVAFGLIATFLLAPLVGVGGGSFLVRVPAASGARGLAVVTLALDAVPLGCGVLGFRLGAFKDSPAGPEMPVTPVVLSAVAGAAILVSFVTFMLCVSKCAAYLEDDGSARHAVYFLTFFLLAAVGGPVVIGVTAALMTNALMSKGVILFAMLIGWVVLMIRQLLPTLSVIETVRKRM
jgi:hypothetical protein